MMESGLPLLNCLLQQTHRSICTSPNSSTSSKWVYAVFWRILPRNFPPPRWEYEGTSLDCSKGSKRNWILVWEDGFCDFEECGQRSSGYMKGKMAADNSHKWVYSDNHNGCEPSYVASRNATVEPQPKAWEFQFKSGIQSIDVISVREGVVQLGSFNKIVEDLNLVINIQRTFSYLQSIPGVFAIQRPYLPLQHPYTVKPSFQMMESNGINKQLDEKSNCSSMVAIDMGWNSPHIGTTGPPPFSIMSSSLGSFLSKLPPVISSYNSSTQVSDAIMQSTGERVKIEFCGFHPT